MTADDVLIDLTGEPFDVVRAERVARPGRRRNGVRLPGRPRAD